MSYSGQREASTMGRRGKEPPYPAIQMITYRPIPGSVIPQLRTNQPERLAGNELPEKRKVSLIRSSVRQRQTTRNADTSGVRKGRSAGPGRNRAPLQASNLRGTNCDGS